MDPHQGRAAAQPAEPRRGHPARPLHGRFGTVRFGQVFARVRHALCRGPALLRRVAVDVRAAVPRAPAQARCRLDRGRQSRRGHRAAQRGDQRALHGRHRDRDQRLPARPVGAGGHRALPCLRRRCGPPHARLGVARRAPPAPRRRCRAGLLPPAGGQRRCRRLVGTAAGPGFPARGGRRRRARAGRRRTGRAGRAADGRRHRRGGRPPAPEAGGALALRRGGRTGPGPVRPGCRA